MCLVKLQGIGNERKKSALLIKTIRKSCEYIMLREIGNKNIQKIPASVTVAMGIRAKALKKQGADVISLAGGEPDFDTPELIRNAAKEALDRGRTHYAAGTGIKELREAIAAKMRRENSIDASADNIIVTSEGKFGLYMTMQALLNDGDEVMLITPAWVSYAR